MLRNRTILKMVSSNVLLLELLHALLLLVYQNLELRLERAHLCLIEVAHIVSGQYLNLVHFLLGGVEEVGQGFVLEVVGQEGTRILLDFADDFDLLKDVRRGSVVLAVNDVLLLDPEEVPNAPSDDLDHADHHQEYSRLYHVGYEWGQSQSPSQPEDEVKHHRVVVYLSILVAEMVPQEFMAGAVLQEAPVVFLRQTICTRSQ